MLWFNSNKKKQKMEFIRNYVPTSKAQLLQVAMFLNKGDLQKAQEMFDFYNKNLALPDFDPIAPTFMQQFKANASGIFSWVKENQEDIIKGYQFVQTVIQNRGILPDMPAADATGVVAGTVAEPLPDINK